MKRPTTFHSVVLKEILGQHNLPASKDVDYCNRRLLEEGESYLTITLPTFAQAIELGLERGFIKRSDFCAFKSRGQNGPLPAFLQGLVMKIFHVNGVLRIDACPDAVFGIRQICYWCKKPKADCSPHRLKKALRQYVETEEELSRLVISDDVLLDQVSRHLYAGSIFSDVSSTKLVCRHGPGATAERLMNNERKAVTRWSERLNDVMPIEDHCILHYGEYQSLSRVHLHGIRDETPVRVVFVPKTMKTPRVIAIEPSHVQFAQQAVMDYLTERLESHGLTRGSVHFTDQSVNQQGAKRASKDRRSATLDLSEASDRVSLDLVCRVFSSSPILPYLLGTRSVHASLDNGKTSRFLWKFASMGSATCFPVEAMVFYALIQRALHAYYQVPVSSSSIRRFSRLIDVYGDDLIVPSETRSIVTSTLEAYGLKVNTKKSFSAGFFRESCGYDYFSGYDVTPVYLRHIPPCGKSPLSPDVLMSLAATSDLLYQRGLWTTSQAIRDYIENRVGYEVPRTSIPGVGLTFFSYRHMTKCKYDFALHTYVQKRTVFLPVKKKDHVDGEYALLESLRPRRHRPKGKWGVNSLLPSVGFESDVGFSVKRGVFKMKRRWIPATIGCMSA